MTPSAIAGRRRRRLVRKWTFLSLASLLVALLAGILATEAKPRWDVGDLLVGLYFAALSLVCWGRSVWISIGLAIGPTIWTWAAALVLGLGPGIGLILADFFSGGRL